MPEDLKLKLRFILHDTGYYGHDLDDAVEAVGEAFREAGWGSLSPLARFKRDNAMTGAYWYDRFEHELSDVWRHGTKWQNRKDYDLAKEVGKRAAGLLESEKVSDAELLDPKNLANLSQTYRNDDTAFQAVEIHPEVIVDHKPLEFKSNVTKLTQADLNKKVFIDMSHKIPGTMGLGEIASFDNRNKIANVLVERIPYTLPYDRLQLVRFAVPWTKL